jgi:hypothetical protein
MTDKETIARYTSGKDAELCERYAEREGGIDRIEGDFFVFKSGFHMRTKPMSLYERWAEEDKTRIPWKDLPRVESPRLAT